MFNFLTAVPDAHVDCSFPKAEKLKSKKIIDLLFKNGQSKAFFPIRIIWGYNVLTEPVWAQCGVSVSKKNFPNATDRNRIKRQLRETYRLNKSVLLPVLEEKEAPAAIMILFTSKEFCDFAEINRQTRRALNFVSKKIQNDAAIVYQNIDSAH